MIYVIIFFASYICLECGYILICKRKSSFFGRISIFIGLLIPILFAAYRDLTIGVDVLYYVQPFFERAKRYTSFTRYYVNNNIDILYAALNFGLSKFTSNIKWLLLINQAIIIICTFLAFWKIRAIARPSISMLYYYFLFYNFSLSTVRQSIGTAILLLGISHIISSENSKKSYLIAVICVLIATGFHTGCLIGIIVVVLYFLIDKRLIKKKYVAALTIIMFVVSIYKDDIISYALYIISLVNVKYGNSYIILSSNSIGILDNKTSIVLCMFMLVLLVLINRNYTINDDYRIRNFNILNLVLTITIMVIDIFFSDYRIFVRIVATLEMLWPLTLAQSVKLVRKNRANRILAFLLVGAIVAVYWWYMNVWLDFVSTMPYMLRH